jgi:hypothetical protein
MILVLLTAVRGDASPEVIPCKKRMRGVAGWRGTWMRS